MQTQTQQKPRLSGMIGFTVVWIGQIVSVLASGMTSFAMTIYMYQQTHSATAMGFVQVAYITPFLIMSPIAGVMVDRYNRKLMMMVSDIAGGIATCQRVHLICHRSSAILAYLYCSSRFRASALPFNGPLIPPRSARWFPRSNMDAPTA
jgi:DHA3 family macrolide efflux protein-like MFS transporter